jgi:hypothetical protein
MISCQDYRVADPDALETPAMLLFQDLMDHNIRSVCELVGGGENLIAHVKTHKCEAVARREVESGIGDCRLQVRHVKRTGDGATGRSKQGDSLLPAMPGDQDRAFL